MKKLVRGLIIGSALGAASCAFADPVAIVNLTQVFNQVPQGQAAFAQLQKQTAPEASKLQALQDSLAKQVQDFQNQKANLTPAQQSAESAQLLSQQAALQKNVSAYQTNLQQQQQALLTTFGNNMKTAVAQIAKTNGYHLVLSSQTAVYNDSTVDITPQVVQAMKNS